MSAALPISQPAFQPRTDFFHTRHRNVSRLTSNICHFAYPSDNPVHFCGSFTLVKGLTLLLFKLRCFSQLPKPRQMQRFLRLCTLLEGLTAIRDQRISGIGEYNVRGMASHNAQAVRRTFFGGSCGPTKRRQFFKASQT